MKWYFALRIVVEGVGKEAAACGIKTEAVESTAVGCTTRLGVSVRGNPDAEPQIRAFRSKAGAYVVLCDAGKLLSGSQRDVPAAVTKSLEEDIKNCLAQLSY